MTFSFWVKATKTGIYCVAFEELGSPTAYYVAEYTVSSSDTWEKKTVTLTFNSGTTPVLTNAASLRIHWIISAGSDYTGATAGAWSTSGGSPMATTNQVNGADSTSNNWRVAQVMLNTGSAALPFTRSGGTYAGELARVQRYYEKSYAIDTDPATATATNIASFHNVASAASRHTVFMGVQKRSAPTVTYYSTDGTSGSWTDQTASANRTVTGVEAGTKALVLNTSATNAYVANSGDIIAGHWVADADL